MQFGVGSASSIGTVNVQIPIRRVDFHIVEVNTPFLLSLANIDKLNIYFDNTRDILFSCKKGVIEVPVVRRFGHAFLL